MRTAQPQTLAALAGWDALLADVVKRLLANHRYAGRAIYGATQSRTRASDGRRGRPLMRPGGPLVVRAIPALVDPSVWGACNPGRSVL